MPFIKQLSTKLGIRPSMRSQFDIDNLTGTQKLLLIQARIFGNSIGGNMKNGSRALRENFQASKRIQEYAIPVWNRRLAFPFLGNPDVKETRKMMDDARKMRIMMRGVKIGKQKGGSQISIMSIYEKKKDSMV